MGKTPKDRLIDKVQGTPVDRTAALVTSRSKAQWDHRERMASTYPHWDTPPKMRPIPKASKRSPTFFDMTGHRSGQLTVVGLYDSTTNKAGLPKKRKRKDAKWVVRCACGRYELRYTKSLRNPTNPNDRCEECKKVARMKKVHHWRTTGEDRMEWEF